MKTNTLTPELLDTMDAYWRAANYLSVGQIYLFDNPLLKRPLTLAEVKHMLLEHWGTTPGQNFIYVHLNRIIKKHDLDMIYVSGPEHGGPAVVANTYLEGTYSEIYPDISQDEIGLQKLFLQFSFPGGIPSHASPECPGSIHEGGELGYSLSHSFGAVFDNPELVVNKKAEVVRVYFPPDANCLLSVMDHCLRSRHYVNLVIAGKHPAPQWLTMDAAVKHCTAGIGIWQWASNDQGAGVHGRGPDVVMVCCGDVPTLETLAAVSILREHLPDLKVRVVNVVEVNQALRAQDFDALALTADAWIKGHGQLQGLVIHARAFPGWDDFGSFFRHMRFVRDHHQKIERIAFAADSQFMSLAPRLGDHFVEAEVKSFGYDALEAAVAWAGNGAHPSSASIPIRESSPESGA